MVKKLSCLMAHGEPARHRNVVFGSQAHHFVEHLDHINVADALYIHTFG